MQASNNTSPLLNHAVRVRTKNVELRKQITQLESDIRLIEKDISTLTNTYEDLVQQCQVLRNQQTDQQKDSVLEEYQTQFNNYIHDIENYVNSKQWNLSSTEKTTVLSTKSSPSMESDHKIEQTPVQTFNDVLNQQLASVENWLMESAVTDIDKQSPMLAENQRTDDGTDDLYKDLIFPTLNDDLPIQSDHVQFDENNHQEEYRKTISTDNSQEQQPARLDKNQRRFALMRQLAEKSNKTVTRKLL